ncbi:heme lyase CcmF/NrfE family subunit [Candidatus Hecatella orcuttiae]|jgi:cytochrome c-type biogenesis protein CcmF|uniref:heme lyase CcmF/NrfE family subunit n=1 Tax=Candidatus Hecatella orcuttiae TaxID=1935119 RepID=UPI002867DCD5|nr:heme lyase CcmF/NrfE family subunit [Candidatus Hecatella orcuttiae]
MIGYVSLISAFLSTFCAIILFSVSLKKNHPGLIRFGRGALLLASVFITIAALWLFYLLVTRDFQSMYVASHTNRALPLVYTLSAFWAGQEGSLLLWAWALSLFTAVTLFVDKKNDEFAIYKSLTLAATLLFFLFTLMFAANPFQRLSFKPVDGLGLNPLLRSPGMIFHPPTLLIGYAGFTIPFAYAMAGLATGNEHWIYRSRKWALSAWIFLSVGIVLGGWWAYRVLGWGGYWAWDPVENASLMPWLVGTAFLHSVMIQEKRRGMKRWNFLLITFTFILVIYATFLTRSGILSSVHSFAESPIGIFFSTFIVLTLIASLGLFVSKYEVYRSRNIFEASLSKEVSFLFNNLLFVVLTVVILVGTTFPLISQALRGFQVTIGAEYYNEVTVPLGLVLIFLMGICPSIAWRRANIASLKRSFTWPIVASMVGLIISPLLGIRDFVGLLMVFICVFVVASHGLEFWRGIKAEGKTKGFGYVRNLWRAVQKNRRRYGGYLVHISIVIILVGITASSVYDSSRMFTLSRGETYSIEGYTLSFEGVKVSEKADRAVFTVSLLVLKDGRVIHEATPSIEYYEKMEQYITRVHIHTVGLKDLYVIPLEVWEDNATFKVKILPFVNLIWIGAFLMLASTVFAMTSSEKAVLKNQDLKGNGR